YVEARDVRHGALTLSRAEFAARIRERLSPSLRGLEFEVDVAAQESRAFNPMMEQQDILFYEPLERSYQHSRVLDLFRRLPVRMAIFRIFARDERGRGDLFEAPHQVLSAACRRYHLTPCSPWTGAEPPSPGRCPPSAHPP